MVEPSSSAGLPQGYPGRSWRSSTWCGTSPVRSPPSEGPAGGGLGAARTVGSSSTGGGVGGAVVVWLRGPRPCSANCQKRDDRQRYWRPIKERRQAIPPGDAHGLVKITVYVVREGGVHRFGWGGPGSHLSTRAIRVSWVPRRGVGPPPVVDMIGAWVVPGGRGPTVGWGAKTLNHGAYFGGVRFCGGVEVPP